MDFISFNELITKIRAIEKEEIKSDIILIALKWQNNGISTQNFHEWNPDDVHAIDIVNCSNFCRELGIKFSIQNKCA